MTDTIDMDELARDGAEQRQSPDKLQQLAGLALDLEMATEEERLAAERLQEATDKRRKLEEIEIPELMGALGITQIRTATGAIIEMATDVVAHISDERRADALAWFRKIGFGDLIKNEVAVKFGAGEDQEADKLLAFISSSGLKFGAADHKETIHPQTLKKFCKDRLKAAEELPIELLGVRQLRRAKVTHKKV